MMNKKETDKNLGDMFNVALRNCEPLLLKFLSKGLVFRGGVAYGDIFYSERKNMFFGEAINKAYEYESQVARYPRIVVDDYVAKSIENYTKKEHIRSIIKRKKEVWDIYGDKDGCIVQKDTDSKYYLNFFNSIQQGCDYSPVTGMNNLSFLQSIIDICNAQIEQNNDNVSICSKYVWLRKYALLSRNPRINKVLVSKKTIFNLLSFREKNLDYNSQSIITIANVGIAYPDDLKYFSSENSTHLKELFINKTDETIDHT